MILSCVNVPVLSVHNTSIAPKFWMAFKFLITVPFLAITLAPLTKFVVTIIGSISGVRPTATDSPKRKASSQSPFVSPLMTITAGAINDINLISSMDVLWMPNSKLD